MIRPLVVLALALLTAVFGPTWAYADHGGPHAKVTDGLIEASAEEHGIDPGTQKGAEAGTAPAIDPSRPRSAH